MQYLLILVWLMLCALIAGRLNTKKKISIGGEEENYSYKFIPALIIFIPIIIMATNRGWIADTAAYISGYRNMPNSFDGISEYMDTISKDRGFYFFTAVIRALFGYNYVPYLFIVALIQGLSIIFLYRKYSSDYVFSVFLFVASTDYISWMFNGMRQFLAVTIILLATPLMIKQTKHFILEKYLPLFAIILFASLFHQSALLMIPFVLICQGKAWNKWTLIFMAAVVVAILFINQFTSILDNLLQETQYKNVVSDYTSWNDDGTNLLRVLVYSVPAILAFIGRKRIAQENSVLINFCTNMSILSAGLYIVSIFTSGIFIGRLPIYCSMYSYILLPWEIKNIFNRDTGKIVRAIAIIAYVLFYFLIMRYQYGLI